MSNINQLLTLLRTKDIRIWLEGDLLKYDSPKGVITKEILDLLVLHKEELMKNLRSLGTKIDNDPILPVIRNGPSPVSFSQQRIWYTCQFKEHSSLYNTILAYELNGNIDLQNLQRALNILIEKHEILRSNFSEIKGIVHQVVKPAFTLNIQFETYNGKTVSEARKTFEEKLKNERQYSFDLENGALLRVGAIKIKEKKWYLWLNSHHIISDGWSSHIIFSELIQYYARLEIKKETVAIQYADYVFWERNKLTGDNYNKLAAFWKNYLREIPEITQLPLQKNRQQQQPYTVAIQRIKIPGSIFTKLVDHAANNDATPFMVFLSAFAQLIFRYTSEKDIVIGTAVANRPTRQTESLIGCFINMIPLRMEQQPSFRFSQMVNATRNNLLSVYEHQAMPFEKIVDEINPRRTLSYNPIVQIMFNMNTIPVTQTSTDGIEFTAFEGFSPASGNYDLYLEIKQSTDEHIAQFTYNSELFDAEFFSRFANHYLNILDQCAGNFETPISEIDVITQPEREKLLNAWQGTPREIKNITVHGLVEKSVETHGASIAMISGDEQISYHELNRKANRFAHYLIHEKKIQIGDTVGIFLDRSIDMVICLLGALKAGACYLPLDTSFPQGRLNYIINDSKLKLIIVKDDNDPFSEMSFDVLAYNEETYEQNDHNPLLKVEPGSLAYLIYTSGSSGAPKGTLIEHRNVVNFFDGMNERFGDQAGTMLSVTSISFDIAVLELFWTLVNGYKIILHKTGLNNLTGNKNNKVRLGKMDFSLFYFSSVYNNETTNGNQYKLLLEGAKFADANGFTAVWTPERHFHEFGGLYPNPSVTGAAVAAITKNIKIRAGSVVLPLHHPLRVAEEWSVIDNISGGRVGISFASGWQINDFVLAPQAYGDKKNFYENIKNVCRLWKGESLPFENPQKQIIPTRIFPKPVQSELPLWITASGDPETFENAGAMGANILTHLLSQTIEELEIKISIYKEARKQNGFNPEEGKISLMLHTFIGKDPDEVRKQTFIPFTNYLRTSIKLMENMAEANGIDLQGKGLTEEMMELLLPKAYDRYVNTSSLIGTIDTCYQMLEKTGAIGVNEICCLIDFGVEYEVMMNSLKQLVKLKDNHHTDLTIADQIREHNVTHFQCTPSMAELLIDDGSAKQALSKLQCFFIGGENLTRGLADKICNVIEGELHNMYGPTETTIWSSTRSINKVEDISIGQPIVNTRFFILDQFMKPVPEGVIGELFIAGDGLAREYFLRPELTRERFVSFQHGKKSVRLYKTGDLVKVNYQGDIIYVGRTDQQVKINGHRIELDEIKNVIAANKEVRRCVVAKRENDTKSRLVAYVELNEKNSVTGTQLKEKLRDFLPFYMMPSAIHFIDEIPLLPSGKVDLKNLQTIEDQLEEHEEINLPSSDIEFILMNVWKQVLGVERIGVDSNYFSLGGDSIRSIQIISKAREAGLSLTLNQLYQFQTIRELATVAIENPVVEEFQGRVEGYVPITPIQQWFFEQQLAQPSHYNQALMLDVPADINTNTLKQVISMLYDHHDALRMRFTTNEKNVVQENRKEIDSIDFEIEDLSSFSAEQRSDVLLQKASEAQARLSIGENLLSIRLFQLGNEQPARLLIIIHHLIIDGLSWRILLEDMVLAYENLSAGKEFRFQPKTASFKKWAEHILEYASSGKLKDESTYWLERPYEHVVSIEPDYFDSVSNTIESESSVSVTLDKGLTKSLVMDLPKNHKTQINDALLTALFLSFKNWTGQTNLLINLEGHGREILSTNIDTSRTVGWFTSLFPVLLGAENTEHPLEVLKSVKEQLRGIPNNGVGYGMLKYASNDRELQQELKSHPSPQIIFNYLGHTDQAFSLWKQSKESVGQAHGPLNDRGHLIDIFALIKDDKLQVTWRYSKNLFKPATIKLLANNFIQALTDLVNEGILSETSIYTPSDFPLAVLDQSSLDKLVAEFKSSASELPREIYKLSPMQEGLLFHILEDPTSNDYFQQVRATFTGQVNHDRLKSAWENLIKTHDIFRTSFHWNDLPNPVQIVQEGIQARWDYVDCIKDNPSDKVRRMEEFLAKERDQKFDLRQAPLIKATLFRFTETMFLFNLSYYHIIMDGWSLPIVFSEIFQHYYGISKPPGYTPSKYKEFIHWLNQQDRIEAKKFWNENLRGFNQPSLFPGVKKSDNITRSALHTVTNKTLRASISSGIKDLTRKHKITMGSFFHSIWGFLLSFYTNEKDVVFGATFSGRPPSLHDAVTTIGLFINTLPVRIKIDSTQIVLDWLLQAQQNLLQCERFGYYPLTDIKDCSELQSGSPLFDSIMVIENYPVSNKMEDQMDISVGSFDSFEQTNYPITIVIVPGDQFVVKAIYDPMLIEDEFVKTVLEKLEHVAEQFLLAIEMPLSKIPVLINDEKDVLLNFGRGEILPITPGATVLDLFAKQVLQHPLAEALLVHETVFSFKELDEYSNQLSHYLVTLHLLQQGDLVGVMLERNEWLLISLLAVLKTGAAYLPIDPTYPASRKNFIRSDSSSKIIIDDTLIQQFKSEQAGFSKRSLNIRINANALACVIYTSGSTGKPKGVMISHRNWFSFLTWCQHEFRDSNFDIVYAVTSISFDLSFFEFLYPLSIGKKIRLLASVSEIETYCRHDNNILLNTVPSVVYSLLSSNVTFKNIRVLNLAGEPIPQRIIDSLDLSSIEVRNLYGPSEYTTYATVFRISTADHVVIGKPIANTRIYILDSDHNMLPIGVTGEICIAGEGISPGYLNLPLISEVAFIIDPYNPEERLYKTGDYGRWLANGNIEFLGRKDSQIKIRGNRVELEEIQRVLTGLPSINEAAVIAKQISSTEKELVAFIATSDLPTSVDVKNYLQGELPGFMIPAHYIELKALPRMPNGKVDSTALMEMALPTKRSAKYRAASNEVETELIRIWKELLQADHIGVDDNFFELGGHSLKAIRLVSICQKLFNVKLPLHLILRHPTIHELATLIIQSARSNSQGIPVAQIRSSYPLSDAQKPLWIMSQFEEGSRAYNISMAFRLTGQLNVECFSQAFDKLIERHEILRTVFRENERGEPSQWILSPSEINFKLEYEDMVSNEDHELLIQNRMSELSYHLFDLQKGPMIRALLMKPADDHYILSFCIHHIISDGWSLEVIARDIISIYSSLLSDTATSLPPLRIHYKDYTAWLHDQLTGNSLDKHRDYWMNRFRGDIPVVDFPSQKLRPVVKTYNGNSLRINFNTEVIKGLRQYSKKAGGTLFMGMVTALKGFLSRYTGQNDITLGSSIAGQEMEELMDQVGFYTNTVALRTQFDLTDSFFELFSKVRETLLGAIEHRLYPFHKLIEDLGLKKGLGRSPLFDIVVNYEGVSHLGSDSMTVLPDLKMEPIERKHRLARFDITFGFIEQQDDMILDIEYNSDIHDEAIMYRFASHFESFIEKIIADPHQPINTIEYIGETERNDIIDRFNNSYFAFPYPPGYTLIDVFTEQVSKTPENIAIESNEVKLTYRTLDEISNRLGRYIQDKLSENTNQLVALRLERNEWLIIAILAVMKSGNAYLPIDPAYSLLRINYIMESSNCELTIDQDMLNEFIGQQENYAPDTLYRISFSEDLAYVIYTSGSTGHPKGVMIEHKAILNTILAQIQLFEIEDTDHCLQFASQSFDASVSEIFITLLSGARLVIINENEKRDVNLFSGFLKEKGITWATIPPAYMKMLDPSIINNVQKIVTAGDQAYVNKALLSKKSGYYINAYGPTETSICATIYKGPVKNPMSIGKPIHNAKIYIMDEFRNVVPIGVTGEIYIGGAGLAREYLNRKDLTKAAFIPNPLNPGERLYKTGDYGRWLTDGNIEFIGRRDTQVKVNGYRIELEEIENVLIQLTDSLDQAVLDVREVKDEKVLVAYIVGKGSPDKALLRELLAQRLPAYMIPHYFVDVDKIPLNQSGKVDRRALPDVGLDDVLHDDFVAPTSEIEKKLVDIWKEVLGLEKIGVTDKFFDIGGTSLKLIELHQKINDSFETQISIVTLFKKLTIAEFSNELLETGVNSNEQSENTVKIITFENEE